MSREAMTTRERKIFCIPERFMRPRIALYVAVFFLLGLGLLMIYSSSSVTAMFDEDISNDQAYYFKRQMLFVAMGLVAAFVASLCDYHWWSRGLLMLISLVTTGLVLLTFISVIGREGYGATRWIDIGPFNLQPSEFAKIAILLVSASLCTRYFGDHDIGDIGAIALLTFGVIAPLTLFVFQPDKGTLIICTATFLVIAYLGGMPRKLLLGIMGLALLFILIISFMDDYSRARIFVAWNPWRDQYGDGFQLIQGIYAFASGGLFGVGVGLSRQKYSYLPMAHNDFVFAVIGEELGLMGTLGMLFAFAVLAWAGFQIALHAPDLSGRLIAAGCTSMLIIQLLVNVAGVLCMIPLTGKPVPFVSYGGSSVLSCCILVGLIASVSRRSALPDTVFDERRRGLATVSDAGSEDAGFTLVGEATPRSARSSARDAGGSFSLVGGSSPRASRSGLTRAAEVLTTSGSDTSIEGRRASRAFSEEHTGGRVTTDASGRRRIDLGPSASERLRSARSSRK